jgi:hypothetical protein
MGVRVDSCDDHSWVLLVAIRHDGLRVDEKLDKRDEDPRDSQRSDALATAPHENNQRERPQMGLKRNG